MINEILRASVDSEIEHNSQEKRQTENLGAHITSDPEYAAEWVKGGGVLISRFGHQMYAAFSLLEYKSMEEMARLKGRDEKKPFVQTTDRIKSHIQLLIERPGIHSSFDERYKEAFKKLMFLGSARHPVGCLLPAVDVDGIVPDRLIGKGIINVDGKPRRTIGFMVAGPDLGYSRVSRLVSPLAGTSINYSNDTTHWTGWPTNLKEWAENNTSNPELWLDNGSGHNRLFGVLADFGTNPEVCILVSPVLHRPEGKSEGEGLSTSVFFIDHDGKARIVRIGSTPEEEMEALIAQVNGEMGSQVLTFAGHVNEKVKKVAPFDYGRIESIPGGTELMDAVYVSVHNQLHRTAHAHTFRLGESAINSLLMTGELNRNDIKYV